MASVCECKMTRGVLCSVTALLVLAMSISSSATLGEETQTYLSPDGRHCLPCPPGHRVQSHCEEDVTKSTCTPCEDHFFSKGMNKQTHCTLCKTECPKNSYEAQKCSATGDLICICNDGFHRFPLDPIDPHFECRLHSDCAEGQGEVYSGNHTHDRLCRNCLDDEFVNDTDPEHPVCQTCTVCLSHMQVVERCSWEKDTQCGAQTNASLPTTASTPPTTEQTPPTDPEHGSDKLSDGEIAGIVIGLVGIALITVIGLIFCVLRKSDPSVFRGEDVPMLTDSGDWDADFIERTVFPYLAGISGHSWKDLIRALPGLPPQMPAQSIIENAELNELHNVKERILWALREWKMHCQDREQNVTKAAILQALRDIGKKDLIENVGKLAPPDTETEQVNETEFNVGIPPWNGVAEPASGERSANSQT